MEKIVHYLEEKTNGNGYRVLCGMSLVTLDALDHRTTRLDEDFSSVIQKDLSPWLQDYTNRWRITLTPCTDCATRFPLVQLSKMDL